MADETGKFFRDLPRAGSVDLADSWLYTAQAVESPADFHETMVPANSLVQQFRDAPVQEFVYTDAINSWWSTPTKVYSAFRQRIYAGVVDSGGTQRVVSMDLRNGQHKSYLINSGALPALTDDHNAPVLLIPDDRPPIVAYRPTSTSTKTLLRIGVRPHALDTLGEPIEIEWPLLASYPHILRQPGTDNIAIMVLQNPSEGFPGWHLIRSSDYGQSWGESVELFRKHYTMHRQFGSVVHFATSTHPAHTGNSEIKYFNVNLATGEIRQRTGTLNPNNFWTVTEENKVGTVPILDSQMNSVYSRANDQPKFQIRSFDVASDGSVAFGPCDINAPLDGVDYSVRKHISGNTWQTEFLVNSGRPFGYTQSLYVGGMTFGSSASEVFLTREEDNVWYLERWLRGTGGNWYRDRVLKQGSTRLARPQNPHFGETSKWLTLGLYHEYSYLEFGHFNADELVIDKAAGVAVT
jgi:hypothetical protein